MRSQLCCIAVVLSLSGAAKALGQTLTVSPPSLSQRREQEDDPVNRFRLGYRMGLGLSTDIKNLSATASPFPPSVTGLTYENGYVARDLSGNTGGLTWYWGYANANQIAGDNLYLSASRSGTLLQDVQNDPQHGLELSYERRLGRTRWFDWGLEAAFNHTWVNIQPSGLAGVVDAYPLNGVTPPLAPYNGSFQGPGPLIGDTPTRYPITFTSQIDASVYGLRLGPFLEFPLGGRLSLSLSGGLALLLVDGEFNYRQAVALPTGPVSLQFDHADFDILPGGYIAGTLTFDLSDSVGVFTSAQFQSGGHTALRADTKQANLNFDTSVFLVFGLSYRF